MLLFVNLHSLVYPIKLQDVCIAAVKEKDIDTKLKQVIADWDLHNLGFKFQGELLLRGEETTKNQHSRWFVVCKKHNTLAVCSN